jgi:hypothetical protein
MYHLKPFEHPLVCSHGGRAPGGPDHIFPPQTDSVARRRPSSSMARNCPLCRRDGNENAVLELVRKPQDPEYKPQDRRRRALEVAARACHRGDEFHQIPKPDRKRFRSLEMKLSLSHTVFRTTWMEISQNDYRLPGAENIHFHSIRFSRQIACGPASTKTPKGAKSFDLFDGGCARDLYAVRAHRSIFRSGCLELA